MIKRVCDMCGKEIEEYTSFYWTIKATAHKKGSVSPLSDTDWCENCHKSLCDLIKVLKVTEDSQKVRIGIEG